MGEHTNTPYSVDEAGRILDSKGFIVADVDNPRVLREWDKEDVDHWSQLPGVTYFDLEEEEEFALAELFARAPGMAEEIERLEGDEARLEKLAMEQASEIEDLEAQRDELTAASIAYDDAIRACGNDPDTMASYCTAEGDTLDSLYFAWMSKARDIKEATP